MHGMRDKPEVVYAGLGYPGVDKDNLCIEIKHRAKDKRLTDQERRLLKRRQAIEPTIAHLKADHRIDRFHRKGSESYAIHAMLRAAGYNIRGLLIIIVNEGLGFMLCLLKTAVLAALMERFAAIIGNNQSRNSDQRRNWLKMNFTGATNY